MTGVLLAALALGLPALAFTLWPLLRRGSAGPTFLPLPADARREPEERKRGALRTLAELEFEHAAGHLSTDDYADLRARHEAETAAILTELDRLGAAPAPPPRIAPAEPARSSAWRHPAVVAGGAVTLVLFGVVLGAGVVRHTTPEPMAGGPMPGSRPLAALPEAGEGGGTPRPITPEMLKGMLEAARAALFAGQFREAVAAYQAVLKREPANVDALSHLGLIVAVAGHEDIALESLQKAMSIDPEYPIKAGESFLAVMPAGAERDRVTRMLAEARGRRPRK
jgi:tetratricopeptide (TPR) repeat protein